MRRHAVEHAGGGRIDAGFEGCEPRLAWHRYGPLRKVPRRLDVTARRNSNGRTVSRATVARPWPPSSRTNRPHGLPHIDDRRIEYAPCGKREKHATLVFLHEG